MSTRNDRKSGAKVTPPHLGAHHEGVEPGYYWIQRQSDSEWIVARYYADKGWEFVMSLSVFVNGEDLFRENEDGQAEFKLGPRIPPPAI